MIDDLGFDTEEAPAAPTRRRSAPRGSVGRTVATAFGVVIGLLVLTVAGALVGLQRLSASLTTVHRDDIALAEASAGLRSEVAALLWRQSAYVLDRGAGRTAFEADLERVDATLGRLAQLGRDPADAARLARIRSGVGALRAVDAEVWEAVRDGRTDDAAGLVAGPGALVVGLLEQDAEALATRARATELADLDRVDTTLDVTRLLLVALGLVAVAVGVVLAVRSARRIRGPLAELEHAARLAAAGDLDVVVAPHADDEIGRLVEAFNKMVGALRRSVTDGTFDTQLRAALEMVDNEPAVIEVLGEAVNEVVPAYATEFLLADPAKAHMEQSTVRGPMPAGPGCPVDSPFGCAAVRSGQVATFPSSGELGTCPHLRNRPYGMVSATCVPVMFMGRALGVIHSVGPAGSPLPEADVERLRVLASQAGSRIGMVRAFDRTQLQASTDVLTGLPNRRALEARADQLAAKGTAYGVVLFDIDRFKVLNDSHGHDAGDRALRRFAAVLRESVRPVDLAVRYGGEEFVVVLPGGSAALGLAVAERVRRRLAELASGSDAPGFTVSAGIATTACQGGFDAVLRAADTALYEAKADGRDRAVLADGEDASAGVVDLTLLDVEDDLDTNPWPVKEPDPVFDRM